MGGGGGGWEGEGTSPRRSPQGGGDHNNNKIPRISRICIWSPHTRLRPRTRTRPGGKKDPVQGAASPPPSLHHTHTHTHHALRRRPAALLGKCPCAQGGVGPHARAHGRPAAPGEAGAAPGRARSVVLKAGLEGRQEWWRDEWDGFPHVLCTTFLPASLWPAKAMMFIRWGSIYFVIYRRVLATLALLVVLVTLMTLTALAISSLAPLLWRISLAFGSSPAGIHTPGVRRTQSDRLRGRTRTSPTATPATLPKKKATFPVFFCAAVARRYAHPSSHRTRCCEVKHRSGDPDLASSALRSGTKQGRGSILRLPETPAQNDVPSLSVLSPNHIPVPETPAQNDVPSLSVLSPRCLAFPSQAGVARVRIEAGTEFDFAVIWNSVPERSFSVLERSRNGV